MGFDHNWTRRLGTLGASLIAATSLILAPTLLQAGADSPSSNPSTVPAATGTSSSNSPTSNPSTAPVAAGTSSSDAPAKGYIVYWDQNEQEDYYASSTGKQAQLERPWDPNGQMCLLNNGTGDYVVGYDPTQPQQDNPGGPPYHQYKQPAIGEELQNARGKWTGRDLYVPGPYHMLPWFPGEDSPPVNGVWNNQSTYTGCAVDSQHNVFGDDIATAQGQFPIPTSGRLVEWFAPTYKQYCILYGPTTGGYDGDHHVDGSGGLAQPGMMTTMSNGNVLLPEAGSPSGGLGGEVLEFNHASFPTSASQCPDGVYPRSELKVHTFVKSGSLPLPMGVAFDPACGATGCYAVSSIFGSGPGTPMISFFDSKGRPANRPSIPGESLSQFGNDPSGFNPFGMAFAPDGTLYFVDIHIQCSSGFQNCGPQDNKGRVARVRFGPGEQPSTPHVISSGYNFPTSVTICVPKDKAEQPCPFPAGPTPPPTKGNPPPPTVQNP